MAEIQDLIDALHGSVAESQLNRAELAVSSKAMKDLNTGLAAQKAREDSQGHPFGGQDTSDLSAAMRSLADEVRSLRGALPSVQPSVQSSSSAASARTNARPTMIAGQQSSGVPASASSNQDLIAALRGAADETAKLRQSTEGLAKTRADEQKKATEVRAKGAGSIAAKKAHENRFGGKGMGSDRVAKAAGLDGAMGAAAAGPAGLAVASFLVLAEAAGKVAQGMEILGNSSKTSAQKFDAIVSEFVPGGAALIHFRDAVNGTADAIRQQERQFAINSLAGEHRAQRESLGNSLAAEVGAARNESSALATRTAGGMTPVSTADRTTLQGERIYREEESRRPLIDTQKKAEALAKAAHQTDDEAVVRLKGLEDKRGKLQGTLAAAKKRSQSAIDKENGGLAGAKAGQSGPGKVAKTFGGLFAGRNKAERNQGSNDVLIAAQGLLANELEIEKQIARTKETGIAAAQKDSAVRKSNIGIAQNELAILQAQGQAMRNNSQRFGALNKIEQMQGLQAFRLVKKHGLDKVAPMVREAARKVAPDFVAKQEERFGDDSDIRKTLKREGAYDKEGEMTAKENRAAEQKVKADVSIKIALDEDALASKIAEAIERTIGPLFKNIEAKQKAEIDKIKEGMNKRNNQ